MHDMVMAGKKPYAVAMVIQVILASTIVVSKVAFDQGLSTLVYIFYRQAAASLLLLPLALAFERKNAPAMSPRLLLKMFLYALVGNTMGLILYNTSLKYTSAAVASAMGNSIPVTTFFMALLLRMEVLKLKSSSGMAKAVGIALCLTGVLVMALYTGPPLRPLIRHHAFAGNGGAKQAAAEHAVSKGLWITWTFLMLLGCSAWSLWIIFQGLLLKEYPNKLLATLIQCLFGMIQSCLVAVVIERNNPSRWKLGLDFSLLAIAYSGIVGTGVSFYLQTWCVDMKGPVFLAMWNPLHLLLTVFCSSLMGEIVHLGTILGGIFLVGGLYSVLWGKAKQETRLTTTLDHQERSREDRQDECKDGERINDLKQVQVPTLLDEQV
ncbi:hypothetical protein ACP70R_015208 [Stipagrostis hirtigluma subsp. patula]